MVGGETGDAFGRLYSVLKILSSSRFILFGRFRRVSAEFGVNSRADRIVFFQLGIIRWLFKKFQNSHRFIIGW